jgi:hypothetical protein
VQVFFSNTEDLANAVAMAVALELHRENDSPNLLTPVERELRRRIFWSCYLLDRFVSCGSKRPSLITDDTIQSRLPSWPPTLNSLPVEGDFFRPNTDLQAGGRTLQGSMGFLIDICRILGTTQSIPGIWRTEDGLSFPLALLIQALSDQTGFGYMGIGNKRDAAQRKGPIGTI